MVSVQVGDVINLRPSAFQAEFAAIAPKAQWSIKYVYEDRFRYVDIWLPTLQQPGGSACTYFGSSQSRVVDIEYIEDKPFIIVTNLFRIIFPNALEVGEIEVMPYEEQSYCFYQAERELVECIDYFEQSYLRGLFQVHERENNKLDCYKQGFYQLIQEGKWQVHR